MKSASNKKKETLTVCIAIGLIAGGVLSASAQQQQDRSADRPGIAQPDQQYRQQPGQHPGVRTDTQPSGMQQGVVINQEQSKTRASNLLEKEVHGQDGQKLGDVEEIILSQDRRSIEHIKVSLDEGDSVKLSMSEVSAKLDNDDALQVQASQQELRLRQTQDRDQARGGREQNEQDSRRISKLIGLDVQGTDGKDVGSINDLIIDTQSGRIETAAVESGGILGIGARLTSVEWQQVTFAANGETASINMTKEQLSEKAQDQDAYWKSHALDGVNIQRERSLQQPNQGERTPGVRKSKTEGQIPDQVDTKSVQN